MKKTDLVLSKDAPDPSTRQDHIEWRANVGDWFWIRASEEDSENRYEDRKLTVAEHWDRVDGKRRWWLACVTHVGSNYAVIRGVYFNRRISLDNLERCEREPDPTSIAKVKLSFHRDNVKQLMGEIQQVCALLGVPVHEALAAGGVADTSTALAIAHGTENISDYEKALVKAKEKTLPALFKDVEHQHAQMARWMRAEMIPIEAELEAVKGVTGAIDGKIHMVELYAGLEEELVQVREGDTAAVDEQVVLLQARRYMDEECLLNYEAGGMSFDDITKFDKWIARDENMFRILPHPRCIVAFRVRRFDRAAQEGERSIESFIRLWSENERNKQTYLYIRNGHQLWRVATSIQFDENLFPRIEDEDLLNNDELWIRESADDIENDAGVIGKRTLDGMVQTWLEKRAYLSRVLWQWHRAGCPEEREKWTYVAQDDPHEHYNWKPGSEHVVEGDPRRRCNFADDVDTAAHYPKWRSYVRLTPDSIYYDDVMKKIRETSVSHNRVAVVLQGLLDRSTCLHPHPPWRIWTPEGFEAAVVLKHDDALVVTAGEAPDWEGYWEQNRKSIKVGSRTVGQRAAWIDEMMNRRGYKWHPSKYDHDGEGPGYIGIVRKKTRAGACTFRFVRARNRPIWVPAERPGYRRRDYPDIEMQWRTPEDVKLFCIDAYTPGDFHMFFDDPRTRAKYIEWAPYMLAAEDWHARQRDGKPTDEDEDD